MWVLSPTYVRKPQHEGKVPTFVPQESIKIWLIIIKFEFILYLNKNSHGTCIESWV